MATGDREGTRAAICEWCGTTLVDHVGDAKLAFCPSCNYGTLIEHCPHCGAALIVPPINWCTECGQRITIFPVRISADGSRRVHDLVDEPDAATRLELEKSGKNWLDVIREKPKTPEGGHHIVFTRGEPKGPQGGAA